MKRGAIIFGKRDYFLNLVHWEEGEPELSLQPCFLKCGRLYDLKIAVLVEAAGRKHVGVKLNKQGSARVSISHEKTLEVLSFINLDGDTLYLPPPFPPFSSGLCTSIFQTLTG